MVARRGQQAKHSNRCSVEAVRSAEEGEQVALACCAFVLFHLLEGAINSFFFVPEPSQPIDRLFTSPLNRRVGRCDRSIDFDALQH